MGTVQITTRLYTMPRASYVANETVNGQATLNTKYSCQSSATNVTYKPSRKFANWSPQTDFNAFM